MQCNDIQLLLPDWVQERENNPDHTEIERHLALCENCRKEAAQFEQLFTVIESDKQYVPPQHYFVNLLPQIHRKIDVKKEKKFYWRFVQFSLPVVTAVILFVALGPFSKQTKPSLDFGLEEVFKNLDSAEVQNYVLATEDDESVDNSGTESSLQETLFSDDDREVLQTLLDENSSNGETVIPIVDDDDETISLSTISDDDADKIVSQLKEKFH